MSHALLGQCTCPNLQIQLNSNYTSCDPTKLVEFHRTSLLKTLLSSQWTNGVVAGTASPGKGKLRTVELWYQPRIVPGEINSTTTNVCTSTNNSGSLCHTCEIDTNVGKSYNEFINAETLATVCLDNDMYIAQRIQAMMNAIVMEVNDDLIDQLSACSGAFGQNETGVVANVKTTRTRKTGTNDPATEAIEDIAFATMNAGYCSVPYIFGWNEIFRYLKAIKAGCCADNGIDFSQLVQQNDMVLVPSSRIPTALGNTNGFLTVNPGAVQLISWNEFQGAAGLNVLGDESFRKGVIIDPNTGLPFDLLLQSNCNGLTIFIKSTYTLCCMPDDMFSAGDRMDGVRFVNEWNISNV